VPRKLQEVRMSANGAVLATDSQSDAASLLRRWFTEVWNEGKEETIDELFPEDAVMWGVTRPDVSSKGSAEFKKFYHAMRRASSGMKVEVDQVVQEGDMAFARFTATMNHTGDGLGIEPTNKSIRLVGMTACRVKEGKIVEGWNIWDQIGMVRELGLLQGPAAMLFP
jgi:predicted ester cyclase